MKKFPKPWYRASRATWYVTLHGVQHNLGQDKDTAWQLYTQLLGKPAEPVHSKTGQSVLEIVERFLVWCQEHRAADTYDWYLWRLQRFAKSIPPTLTVTLLRHFHVDDFLTKQPNWSSSTKHGMVRAVQRALRWAQRKGYIDKNPLADYEKPRPGKRKVIITPGQFEEILELAGTDQFRDLLIATWETGCRPQESLVVEARHVDLANARWVFPADEAKGDQWPRIVYLTDATIAITRRLMLKHPEGPLFRNSNGKPWTTYAVNCAFIRVQLRLGKERMAELSLMPEPLPKLDRSVLGKLSAEDRKVQRQARKLQVRERSKQLQRLALDHGMKYCLYNLRHSWLDGALKRGVDALTCAILMGHRDPSTISKVYQHLSQSPDYLRNAAKKAAG